jgi:apolipoprotein N-acyltransferase
MPAAATLARAAAALGLGAALGLAFPPYGWWPLALPCLAGMAALWWSVPPRRALWLGALSGFAFFLVVLVWMRAIGADAWILLAALQAAYVAGCAALVSLTRALGWRWLAFAGLWLLQEWVRARIPWGGLAWARLAFAAPDAPPAGLAAWGGAPLVSFAWALAGGLLADAALRFRAAPRRAAATAAAAIAVLGLGLAVPRAEGGPETASVGAVQGSVPRIGIGFLGEREQVLRNHVRELRALTAGVEAGRLPQPDFVVLPENASDVDLTRNPAAKALVDRAVAAVGVPTLVGSVERTEDELRARNTAVVWDPETGPGDTYVKQRLVPFGEFIPFRSQLARYTDRIALQPRDFEPGTDPAFLTIADIPIGIAICFEVAEDAIVREGVALGGQALVVQTNNATYTYTGQLQQQWAITRLRAIEHGRSVVVAATTGITGFVRPDGSVAAELPEYAPGHLVEVVALSEDLTPATRLGDWPDRVLVLIGVSAVVAALIRRRGAKGAQQ